MKRLCAVICVFLCLSSLLSVGAEFSLEGESEVLSELRVLGLVPDGVSPDKRFSVCDLARFAFRLKNPGERLPNEVYGTIAASAGYADAVNLGGEYLLFTGYAMANRLFEPQASNLYGIVSDATAAELAYVCLRLLGIGENYLSEKTESEILSLAAVHINTGDDSYFSDPERTFTFDTAALALYTLLDARTVNVAVMPNTLSIVRRTVTLRKAQYGEVSVTRRRIVSLTDGGYITDTGLFVPADKPSQDVLGLYADVSISENGVGLAVSGDTDAGSGLLYDGASLSQSGFMLLVPGDELAFMRIAGQDFSVYLSSDDLIWFCGPESTVARQIACGDVMLNVAPYYNERPSYTIRCVVDKYDRPVYLRIYPR